MKENKYLLNTVLAVVFGIALLVCVLVRSFAPAVILPRLNIPGMVLLALVALLLDHYLAKNAKRCYLCIPVLSALTFGLLPFACGFATLAQAGKLALIGGIVFTATTWLYTSIQDRLSTGPAAKAAPFFSALGLYLAAQCFAGIIL
jgi:hypothetical protein